MPGLRPRSRSPFATVARRGDVVRSDGGTSPEEVDFAERHGPTVLLIVGISLILAGIGAVFANHQLVAGGMFATGVVAIVVAVVVTRMVGPFRLLFLSGNLRPTDRDPSA
jgi:hypothetical protein